MAPRVRQVLWFVGLWAAGVLAVGALALLLRSALKPLAAMALAAPAMDCADAVALLRPDLLDTPRQVQAQPARCAMAAWPDRLLAVAVARDDSLLVGLIRGAPAFATVEALGEVEAIALDPLREPVIAIIPVPLVGPAAIGVRLTNRAEMPERRTETEALHVLLPREAALAPVLAVLLRAEHEALQDCPRGRRPPCRVAWSRHWMMDTAGPARGGAPPELVLREARSGAVASRHRWTGERYAPAVYDRTPPIRP